MRLDGDAEALTATEFHCATNDVFYATNKKPYTSIVEMVNLGPARGPKRADTGRAGPENPGPRAFTGRNGPKDFIFKTSLFIVALGAG